MGGGAAIALRTVFGVLGCVMVATLIYTISTSGLPFHRDLLTRWMAATLLDFYIHVAAIGAWVFYKESSWIMAVVWIVLLVCFGSITTCGYIVLQFFKLSPEESLEDPLYFVLARRWRKDGTVQRKRHSVVGARIIFTALGFLMLATLVYVGITDDSSLSDILTTPWMVATLIDFYINVVALSVWVAYKESSWIRALVWIILLACFGSTATCAYIVWQLSHLSSQDPLYLVLFNSSNSALLFLLVEASGKSDLYFVLKVLHIFVPRTVRMMLFFQRQMESTHEPTPTPTPDHDHGNGVCGNCSLCSEGIHQLLLSSVNTQSWLFTEINLIVCGCTCYVRMPNRK